MRKSMARLDRILIALAAMVVGVPAVPVLGQTTPMTGPLVSVDAPSDGMTVTNGTAVLVGGWAADPAIPSTGVDMVRVYLDGRMDEGGTLIGSATYGDSRPDVASALGNAAFSNSGFNLLWTPAGLSSGFHTLYIYAHSVNGWTSKSVRVSAQAQPTATPPPARGYIPPPMYPGPNMGMPGPYPIPPMYPVPQPGPPPGERVCIMIYPPPPGC